MLLCRACCDVYVMHCIPYGVCCVLIDVCCVLVVTPYNEYVQRGMLMMKDVLRVMSYIVCSLLLCDV